MSIVYPDDLATYLGSSAAAFDAARADLILDLAHGLCETVLSPLTEAARSVVLEVAARAYTNPSSAHAMGLGSAQVSLGSGSAAIGGLFLSKKNVATLRRIAGGSGAFSVSLLTAEALAD